MMNSRRSASVINPVTTDDSHLQTGSNALRYRKSTPRAVRRVQRRTRCVQCMYCCGMPKGTSWDEAMLNSEKIKPVALAFIQLRLPEGIR